MTFTEEKFEFNIKPLTVLESIILYITSFISLFFALLTVNWDSNLYLLYLFIALMLNPTVINTLICEISCFVSSFNAYRLRNTCNDMNSFEKANFDAEIKVFLSTQKDDR